MSGNIFINYRRDDEAGFVHALYGQLEKSFPREQLFMDVDHIPFGKDFIEVLDQKVSQCEVLLAIIGKDWLEVKKDNSQYKRLDDPNDFVRIEIASALSRKIPVIPVLVNNATIPNEDELPDDLKPLIRRQAIKISHDRFRSDVGILVDALKGILKEKSPLKPPAKKVAPNGKQLNKLLVPLLGLIGICAVVGVFYIFKKTTNYQVIKVIEDSNVQGLATSQDRTLFALLGKDLQLRTANDVRTHRFFQNIHDSLPNAVSISPSSKIYLTGGCGKYSKSFGGCVRGEAKLWFANSPKSVKSFDIYDRQVHSVAFSVSGKTFFTAGCDDYNKNTYKCEQNILSEWNLDTFKLKRSIPVDDAIYAISAHPNGKVIFIGGYSKILQLNLQTGIVTTKFFTSEMGYVYSLSISNDGKTVISGGTEYKNGNDYKVRVWDVRFSDPKFSLGGHLKTIHNVDISPDGGKIVSTSEDRTVRIWDAKNGALLQTLKEFDKKHIYAGFIGKDNKIVTVEQFSGFKIWENQSLLNF